MRSSCDTHSLPSTFCLARGRVLEPILATFISQTWPFSTAWIGSIAFALVFFAGPLAGSLAERFGCRTVALTGSLLCTVAMVASSFATDVGHYFFTYGVLFGLGGCFVRVPTFLVTGRYFERRRALATGIISAGAGLGVLCSAPFTQFLLDNLNLANTYRAMAAPCLLMAAAVASYAPPEVETEEDPGKMGASDLDRLEDATTIRGPPKRDLCRGFKVIDCSLWRYPAFTIIVLTFMAEISGYSVPIQHLVSFTAMCD